MSATIEYYKRRAREFFQQTVAMDLSELYARFLANVPVGGWILDAGCGSGRDAKAFRDRGYRVSAFDACRELVELASERLELEVAVRTFDDVDEESQYDAVWACASLLHVEAQRVPAAMGRLWNALKPGGQLYVSFKHGTGERVEDGRHFTDATEEQVRAWLERLPGVRSVESWTSPDRRPDRTTLWTNAIATRDSIPSDKLIPGGASPFLPHLCHAIRHATEIDLAVAFIKTTGLRLLLPDLHEALKRKHVRVRVLTSDYLDVTDPDALRLLMLLKEQGAQPRVFESGADSFHLKAYLFVRFDGNGRLRGQAFVGSSNISRLALQEGVEWNYRIDYPGDAGFLEVRSRFEELFAEPRTVELTDAWIDAYEARRIAPVKGVAPGSLEKEKPPEPTPVQMEALAALKATREEGYSRGLVVMATGLGKTWLAAFDAQAFGAKRVLFVAHRDEILQQAAETFLRIWPSRRVGFYRGQQRDADVDVLCASVQTFSKQSHRESFPPNHFDYAVVDEFHHASAATYRRLLEHLRPGFLLGLTATPDRTDQADILSLCDDNLVFQYGLVNGINNGFLAPFHYYGIFDEEVNYQEIPWRNGKFDIDALTNKVATLGRAKHVLAQWGQLGQRRTLAFCVSIRHADFMAEQFRLAGVKSAAVHGDSELSRGEALEQLRNGGLQVVFSVDLFNEGVDLPQIDTVMLLRPTESKVLFLQQIGRGLRRAAEKEHLTILDFVGNHHSFLRTPQALFGIDSTYQALAAFVRAIEDGSYRLPEGCFVHYDLKLIEFMKALSSSGLEEQYDALASALGRRPTALEFYRSGASLAKVRQQHGSWFEFVAFKQDAAMLKPAEFAFLRELETTTMTKSYKMVLLEAFQELDGWRSAPTLEDLAARSWEVLHRRPQLRADLPEEMKHGGPGVPATWQRYWLSNPVNAWIGGNRPNGPGLFGVVDGRFTPNLAVEAGRVEEFSEFVQELVDFRLGTYESRLPAEETSPAVVPITSSRRWGIRLPYFPNLRVACGHFRTGRADAEEYLTVPEGYGKLDPSRHFIAQAIGNSMNGGKHPIRSGDYLLLEFINAESAGSNAGKTVVIERQDTSGDEQYLIRNVKKEGAGRYSLLASNPEYEPLTATDEMRTVARLRTVLDRLDVVIGRSFFREEIPGLFGEEFNVGNWNVGHVRLADRKAHVLLVTLDKRGKAADHRYIDHWIDPNTFHWQSQRSTSPADAKGREIIDHERLGIKVYLFVRDGKLSGGKSAPFVYHGPVE